MGAQLGILPGRRWGSPAKGARMSESKGFDMSKMSTAGKVLITASALYVIDVLLFGIALLAWEIMWVADVKISAPRALVSAGLAAGIVIFTVLKIIVDSEYLALFAWVGLILALVIGYGGWLRWQEHQAAGSGAGGGMPPPSDGMSA